MTAILAGPLCDRFSRRKIIYTLDFVSTGLYLLMGLFILKVGFNLIFICVSVLIIGSINGVYQVAYSSFYPMLIPDGYYSEA